MKTTNTFKRLLTVLFAAAAMSLAACGGGDSGGDSLPEGKVGTVGDGVNTAEFSAIQCGMSRVQVITITGDGPNKDYGSAIEWSLSDPYTLVFFNDAGLVREKAIGKKGQANPITQIGC